MKVVEYSTQPFEKEWLAKANHKKHDITLISNSLSEETTFYAEGKDAVIVSAADKVSATVINKLFNYGVKYITTRSYSTNNIDTVAAKAAKIKIAHLPESYIFGIIEHALTLINALNAKLISQQSFNKNLGILSIDKTPETTVGIIGTRDFGQIACHVFKSFGYKVLYHDIEGKNSKNVHLVSLDKLYASADIISLHVPNEVKSKHFINKGNILKMKDGVMLINTSKGNLVKLDDVLDALNNGKLSFLGMDIYNREFPKAQDKFDIETLEDPTLQDLLNHPNAIVISYQEFLTPEILQDIAEKTIQNLDQWQEKKCLGKNCSCARDCKVELVFEKKA